ncbi:Undecaprenyl-phosphate mannosyltransferase [Planctomycetes bacterium Pan216]|uniref:Undecaprenyl-phosphate mannosyltransferase n=1 Tax=Kolteria novifilia TaxID=2527975 RepID=A0A518B8D8_9BACT|nr:Undecaprenyl-phosphate mannosyltransferase [Planctomycetes bacterium Pan216]
MRTLLTIPVYNEEGQLGHVLERSLPYAEDILVVDDGSTDGTLDILKDFPSVKLHQHAQNRGYGAALRSAFAYGCEHGYDVVVTMDSDGQHEPDLIPRLVKASKDADIVSGSRYLATFDEDTPAPKDRRRINLLITDQLNACLGLQLTDTFCGFKAYTRSALEKLHLTEDGYSMPLELWVQAACHKLTIVEVAVPRVYLDPSRSFGETLDDSDARMEYYQRTLDRAIAVARRRVGCGLELRPRLQEANR